jgi:predicted  nucleic acid-binding Zn-ribbon protein
MKNKIIVGALIIIGLAINGILLYPEVNNFIKNKEDYKYYQSVMEIKNKKEKEEEDLDNNVSELDTLNNKTNSAKVEAETIGKEVKDKNKSVKELDNKIKNVENKIKNGTKERDRLKAMFE